MPAGNQLNYILAKKSRAKRLAGRDDVVRHIDDVHRNLKQIKSLGELVQDYVPMRLTTLVEVYIRSLVRDLVDEGAPYDERASKISKTLKVDFLFALNLQGKKVSLGDLVAHEISLNDVTQILSVLEYLLPDIRRQLATIHDREAVELRAEAKRPIISDVENLFSVLSRMFEVRHIVTHELPATPPYGISELEPFVIAARDFISALDWIVDCELFGGSPLTQADMNQSAFEEIKIAEAQLDATISRLLDGELVDDVLLRDSQEAWKRYVEVDCKLRASVVTGGSMYPMVYATEQKRLVDRRIEDLRWWIEREEGDL